MVVDVTAAAPMTNDSDSGQKVDGLRQLGAVLEALFVTFLWSTSYVLMKLGLHRLTLHDSRHRLAAGLRFRSLRSPPCKI